MTTRSFLAESGLSLSQTMPLRKMSARRSCRPRTSAFARCGQDLHLNGRYQTVANVWSHDKTIRLRGCAPAIGKPCRQHWKSIECAVR